MYICVTSQRFTKEAGPLNRRSNKVCCLCGVNRPTLEFITHMEKSPLAVNVCKLKKPMLETHGDWAVRVL